MATKKTVSISKFGTYLNQLDYHAEFDFSLIIQPENLDRLLDGKAKKILLRFSSPNKLTSIDSDLQLKSTVSGIKAAAELVGAHAVAIEIAAGRGNNLDSTGLSKMIASLRSLISGSKPERAVITYEDDDGILQTFDLIEDHLCFREEVDLPSNDVLESFKRRADIAESLFRKHKNIIDLHEGH